MAVGGKQDMDKQKLYHICRAVADEIGKPLIDQSASDLFDRASRVEYLIDSDGGYVSAYVYLTVEHWDVCIDTQRRCVMATCMGSTISCHYGVDGICLDDWCQLKATGVEVR